jgi:TPR repeat protein
MKMAWVVEEITLKQFSFTSKPLFFFFFFFCSFIETNPIYRKAATLNHPGAMYRLGVADVNGELGLSKNPRDGVKWLKRSAEAATSEYPHAIHELALLHERGIPNVVFVDLAYAVSLYVQAAELGYAPSAFRLGECYEYGKLECNPDPAMSIHFYTIAAQQGHREACFALTAWYLVGSPQVLPQSDEDAYLWARRAAEKELPKAEYAVGYFTEVGIGIAKNPNEAMEWYKKAAEHGDKRAIQRLQGKHVETKSKKKNGSQEECNIM